MGCQDLNPEQHCMPIACLLVTAMCLLFKCVQELGFQFGRLFAVPRDEIMDAVAPAAQVFVQQLQLLQPEVRM